jgi:hypothetical protein
VCEVALTHAVGSTHLMSERVTGDGNNQR